MVINYQKIYEKLGYLFYAIAAADQHVKFSEEKKLRELVTQKWVPLENSTDEFNTDAAYYISIAFDYLLAEGVSAEEAFRVFQEYYTEHKSAFDQNLKKQITATAQAIAQAFARKNQQEQKLLAELSRLLKT